MSVLNHYTPYGAFKRRRIVFFKQFYFHNTIRLLWFVNSGEKFTNNPPKLYLEYSPAPDGNRAE